MNDSTINLPGAKLLRSSVIFPVASLVVAAICGIASQLWAYLPRHWTTTFSVPIAGILVIAAILMSVRSKRPLRSLLACLCILSAMSVDLVVFVGFQAGLLAGVVLAQIGLFAAASLPSIVRLEKAVLWILATLVQSVWIHDVATVGKHISFFGPTMIQ